MAVLVTAFILSFEISQANNLFINVTRINASYVYPYDQNLNTTDMVIFDTVTTNLLTAPNVCYSDGTNCTSSGNSSGGSGNITGSGTTNYIAKWSHSSNIITSNIYDDTTRVVITGDTNITGTLSQGSGIASGQLGSAFGYGSLAVGDYSLAGGVFSNASGRTSLAYGLAAKTTHSYSIALGESTLGGGTSSVAIGQSAKAMDSNSVAIGYYVNTTGLDKNMALGQYVNNAGQNSVFIGVGTLSSWMTSTSFNTVSIGVAPKISLIVNSTNVVVNATRGLCLNDICRPSWDYNNRSEILADYNHTSNGAEKFYSLFNVSLRANYMNMVECWFTYYSNLSSNGIRYKVGIRNTTDTGSGTIVATPLFGSAVGQGKVLLPYTTSTTQSTTTGTTTPSVAIPATFYAYYKPSSDTVFYIDVDNEEYLLAGRSLNILKGGYCEARQT